MATVDVEKTVEAAVPTTEAKPTKGKGRGRKAKKQFQIPAGTSLESVPEGYDPERHAPLKEDDFRTLKHFKEYRVWVHEQAIADLKSEIEMLADVDEDLQDDMAAVSGNLGKLASGLKNIQAGCLAKLNEAKASGDAATIAEAQAKYDRATARLNAQVNDVLAQLGLA